MLGSKRTKAEAAKVIRLSIYLTNGLIFSKRKLSNVFKLLYLLVTFSKKITIVSAREESVNQIRLCGSEGERRGRDLMSYRPQHIANYFLERANYEGLPISPLKLVKLVYIAYGWHLALFDERLFDEPIEAWKHGPVIPSLYHEFKHFKNEPINEPSEDIDFDTWEKIIPKVNPEDSETIFSLDKVWTSYRRFKAWDLRDKTHEKDSPWDRVYKSGERGIKLKDEDIKEHYISRITEYLNVAKSAHSSAAAS